MDLLASIPGYSRRNFEVHFDVYTPRAHFVILPIDKSLRNYSMLNHEQKQEVLDIAQIMIENYNLGKMAVFALHSGSWVSKTTIFHAHICVNVNDYSSIFKQRESQMDMKQYVTKQWKSRNPGDYLANVRGYPTKTYWRDEVQQIERLLPRLGGDQTGVNRDSYRGFELRYHPSQPHIGFTSTDRHKDRLRVLEVMNQFAADNGMVRGSAETDEHAGCHICIPLDGKSYGFREPIQGYIRVSGVKFVQLCPSRIRQEWFRQFRSAEVKALT